MEARAVLRQLLRAVDTHLTRVAGNNQWHEYAVQQFRANAALQDARLVQEQLQIARDYTFLINTVAHHKGLLKQYNLGVDPDERSKQMVNAMARRMGFEMPSTHTDAAQQPQQHAQNAVQQTKFLHQDQQQQQQQQARQEAGQQEQSVDLRGQSGVEQPPQEQWQHQASQPP